MRFIYVLVFLYVTIATLATPLLASDRLIVVRSDADVETTVERLSDAVEAAGATVFAVIDHTANARKVQLDLPPTVLVIFGNPKVGTPLMKDNRLAGLDLPVRVLVWEEDGETRLAALSADGLKARYALDRSSDALGKMESAVNTLIRKAAGNP